MRSKTMWALLRSPRPARSGLACLLACGTLALGAPAEVVVRPGDTLWAVARRHGVTVSDLAALNALTGESLRPGQVLRLPAPASAGAQPGAGGTVTAGRGDSLYALARRHATSVTALMILNGLESDRLVPGQVLRLPRPPGPEPLVVAAPSVPPAPALPPTVAAKPSPATERPLWPVVGTVTSRFGGGRRGHAGLDIGAPRGTPVSAVVSGRVTFAGWNPQGFGNLVVVRGGDGRDYYYAHSERVLVRTGEVVDQGHRIALVGSTGRSTGPHLHLEVRSRGTVLNPLALLPKSRVQLASYRERH